MNSINSYITILTCHEKGKKAAKKFSMVDGKIEKVAFSAGTLFTHTTLPVSSLEELAKTIDEISNDANKFIIKGQIRENMPEVVRRKMHEPSAAFDAVPRPYVMLDIDKEICPAHFDPALRAEEAITWIKNMLPPPFRDASCYYRFSSSQNVHIDKIVGKTLSVHLWFWCDQEVSDEEWKSYFRSQNSPVDLAIFSAVQPHFTAKPIFDGMSDPLPKRSGLSKGNSDVVSVPDIPQMQKFSTVNRLSSEPIISEEDSKKAIDLLKPYYKEGVRNKLCGAIAATLYRGGWNSENAAYFVYELARSCDDHEIESRYNNAIRICDAVDKNLPAQGVPTLKNEIKINELDTILNLLGVGNNTIDLAISKLGNTSELNAIKDVMKLLLSLPIPQRDFYLDEISKQTLKKKGEVKSIYKTLSSGSPDIGPQGMADELMETLLTANYGGGEYLIYSADKVFWRYNGRCWEQIPDHQIKKYLLPHAREIIAKFDGGNVSSLNSSVLNILEGRVYREDDPLRSMNKEHAPVINCLNGELWFDDNGDFELKPHRADSYLRHCLDVEFDPNATSPKFDKAVLDIFSKSSDPADMVRHFMELAGYICQPWRKLAIIVLLHGNGSNGKTSLLKVIRKVLGKNTIMSDRISDIEGDVFKIGDLDGKLLLIDDDVDGGTCLPDGFLKKISEEKHLTGQHKHKPPFEFISRAVPVMLANDYPVTKDLSNGLRRRLLVIPFARTFDKEEIKVNLFEEICRDEASGILNHIVHGFQRLRQRGIFDEPLDCLKAREEWIRRSNTLTTFIDEMCAVDEKYRISGTIFRE